MPGAPDPVYVQARCVLLDALEALHEHQNAVILVGAQAICLHTGEGDLAIAPYTSDADLALDPSVLADDPKLVELLAAAGFASAPDRIGTWVGAHNVPVDLLVPEALGGPGRRAARLGAHGDRVARKGRGLEAVVVDNALMAVEALESGDDRRLRSWLPALPHCWSPSCTSSGSGATVRGGWRTRTRWTCIDFSGRCRLRSWRVACIDSSRATCRVT